MVQYAIIRHFHQKVGKNENFNSAPIFRVKHQMSSYISKCRLFLIRNIFCAIYVVVNVVVVVLIIVAVQRG